MTTIAWTRAKLADLKIAYEAARLTGSPTFLFTEQQGTGFFRHSVGSHPFNTSYAKYLIEYLETQFAEPDTPAQPYNEGTEDE